MQALSVTLDGGVLSASVLLKFRDPNMTFLPSDPSAPIDNGKDPGPTQLD